MTVDRWVVLGLAHPRAGWFSELARWSTTAAIPVDFVKCVSPHEVKARLAGGRAYSALLVGGDVAGLDRDLVDCVRSSGAAVIVVGPVADRNWAELGVAGVLPEMVDRVNLLAALREHASPIPRIASLIAAAPVEADPDRYGRLIAVTGIGGGGSSVVAMSMAQAFSSEPGESASVLLADLALDADLGMLHDTREVMPGVQELVEAHQAGRLPDDQVRSLAFDAVGRGYHLLLGLRRHRDWTAIRPRSFAASLDGLLRSYRMVIADIDPDVEGEGLTGSLDIEDRNTMARATTARADLVVVVGLPTTKGLHALTRTIRSLIAVDVDPERIVAVCNRAPRGPRRRAEVVAALAALLGPDDTAHRVGNPVFLAERGDVEDSIRDGVGLPIALGRPLRAELVRRFEQNPPHHPSVPEEPELVVPGSLGSWTEEAG
jgi:hypothetical protein